MLPIKGELSWGKSSHLQTLKHVLIKVSSSEGHTGIAEAPVRPGIYGETIKSIEAIIALELGPRLLNLDLADEDAIYDTLHRVPNNHTAKGALDIALSEIRAKSQGKTLFEAQRGPQERLRVSFILGISNLDNMLAEAKTIFAQGVRVFKIKIGRDAKHDRRVIEALSTEFAPEVILYADANEGLSLNNAARELEQLAKLGIAYIEEPLPVELIRARAELRAAKIMPIIADDSCFSLRDLHRELELNTFDILNIKTARTGFTESAKMLVLAQEAGKGVMLGSQASSSLGSLHCAIFASKEGVSHPSELSFPLKLNADTLDGKLSFDQGYLDVNSLSKLKLKTLAEIDKVQNYFKEAQL